MHCQQRKSTRNFHQLLSYCNFHCLPIFFDTSNDWSIKSIDILSWESMIQHTNQVAKVLTFQYRSAYHSYLHGMRSIPILHATNVHTLWPYIIQLFIFYPKWWFILYWLFLLVQTTLQQTLVPRCHSSCHGHILSWPRLNDTMSLLHDIDFTKAHNFPPVSTAFHRSLFQTSFHPNRLAV